MKLLLFYLMLAASDLAASFLSSPSSPFHFYSQPRALALECVCACVFVHELWCLSAIIQRENKLIDFLFFFLFYCIGVTKAGGR